MDKFLSFGFDTENPHGDYARTKEGDEFRTRQIEQVKRINQVFNAEGASRTFFILGDYLNCCLRTFNQSELQQTFDINNPLIEIQQHTFSHQIFRKVKNREDKQTVSPERFIQDVAEANATLEIILGITPFGLRMPLGYHHDMSDMPNLVKSLESLGIKYLSSDTRSETTILASMNKERQPHNYGNIGCDNVIEIPTQGWQDVIFTRQKSMHYLGKEPFSKDEIVNHYCEILDQASNLDIPKVSVALALHPWAVLEYDPNLETHKRLIDVARQKGFEIKTYGQVVEIYSGA